ncbi:MAG: NUDIX hydrolase [Mycobacteriales bacterium]
MPIQPWQLLSRKEVLAHPRLTLVEDRARLPDGREIDYLREPPGAGDAVTIVATDADGRVLLQREYSYPPDEVLWQFPGGAVDIGEDPITAARRELQEESGYVGGALSCLGSILLDNRRSDGRMHLYQCQAPELASPSPDATEFLEHHWLTGTELRRMVADGEVSNCFGLAALALWWARRQG